MPIPAPRVYAAGEREAGVACPHCREEIVRREMVAICSRCGATHHEACWNQNGCGSYDCAPASRDPHELSPASIRVTFDQLETTPLPSAAVPGMRVLGYPTVPVTGFDTSTSTKPRPSGAAAIASIIIALVARRPRQRGAIMASLAILIGLGDFIGWTLYLVPTNQILGKPGMLAEEFELDADDFQDQPAPIARALSSNVLIEVEPDGLGGLLSRGLGSGVILDIKDGTALIMTNRHVVDPQFAEGGQKNVENPPLPGSKIYVKMVGHPKLSGTVSWIAPFGVDLALVHVPGTIKQLSRACWDAKPKLQIGSAVFAVGNPHGLAWTHTQGTISQIRRLNSGAKEVKVIQTTAAINPGNSGGGLYDADGRLIGINTWTQDKHFAEGLGFAISFQAIRELIPESFQLPLERSPPVP